MQNPLGAFGELPPQHLRPGLGYVALPVDVPGLVLLRRDAEPRADVARPVELVHAPAGNGDEARRRYEPDVRYLHEPFDLRLEHVGLRELAHLLLYGLYRHGLALQLLHQGPHDVAKFLRNAVFGDVVEAFRRTVRYPEAHRLCNRAYLQNLGGALLYELVADFVEVDHLLVLVVAQPDRKQFDVGQRHAGKRPRVVFVVLGVRLRDHAKPGRIRDDGLESHARADLVDPSAVRACFKDQRSGLVLSFQERPKAIRRGGDGRLAYDLGLPGLLRHDADFRRPVAHVGANCGTIYGVHLNPPVCRCFCTATLASAFQITL